jgi:hypothetical protein
MGLPAPPSSSSHRSQSPPLRESLLDQPLDHDSHTHVGTRQGVAGLPLCQPEATQASKRSGLQVGFGRREGVSVARAVGAEEAKACRWAPPPAAATESNLFGALGALGRDAAGLVRHRTSPGQRTGQVGAAGVR